MTLNFQAPSSRQPRGIVKINGNVVSGWLDFDVDNNNYFSADTFRVRLALNAVQNLPNSTVYGRLDALSLPTQAAASWFSEQQDMFVELFIGEPADPNNYSPGDLVSWIYGQVDDIDYDPVQATVTLTGRDLTRVFIDTKTTQKWTDQTSSQIAQLLAKSHGLDCQATATTTKAGDLFKIGHVNLTDDRSEWDLLNYLATAEGFVVYVRGQTLFFGPAPTPQNSTPYQLVWVPGSGGASPSANFQHITLRRALTVSRGIQVVVRSWNKRNAAGFTIKYPASTKTISVGKSTVGDGAQIYSKVLPNKDKEYCQRYAENWYNQLIQHEMRIEGLVMPGDNALDVTSIISLTGTGTAFDQTYYPDSINRAISLAGGYTMTVHAKNHSTDSQVATL